MSESVPENYWKRLVIEGLIATYTIRLALNRELVQSLLGDQKILVGMFEYGR